jgi:uncharacterized protein YraI
MGEIDFLTDTDDDLSFACDKIAAAQREYDSLAHLQTVFMSDYKMLDGIDVVVYENGTEIAANLTDDEKIYRGESVPAWSYKIFE